MRVASRMAVIIGCLIGILMVGCASTTRVDPFSVSGRTWPEAPDLPRVSYVGEFSSAKDLAITEGLFGRLINLSAGAAANALKKPMAVATSADAKIIFVADADVGCLHRFDLAKHRYRCLYTASGEALASPVGLAVIDGTWIIVADSASGQLYKAGFRDKQLKPFYVGKTLKQPTGIYWDGASQQLYIVDTGQQSVFVFDEAGNHKATIGGRGGSLGEFNYPTYVWVDSSGELLVTDSLNFRMQIFDAEGNASSMFGRNGDWPGDFSRPKGVAADSYGHVYIVDALLHTVQIFDKGGRLLLTFGERGHGEGQFWLPNGIFITPDNMIFVADVYNKRVQVFRYVGGGV